MQTGGAEYCPDHRTPRTAGTTFSAKAEAGGSPEPAMKEQHCEACGRPLAVGHHDRIFGSCEEAPDAALRGALQALVEKFNEQASKSQELGSFNERHGDAASALTARLQAAAYRQCAADLVAVLRPQKEEEEGATRAGEPSS